MTKGKSRSTDLALRKKQCAELYLKGHGQGDIADKLRITPSQVATTLKSLREEWIALALVDFDTKKAEELVKIDRLEATAWEAWERSCQDEERKRVMSEKESRLVGKGEKATRKMVPARLTEETMTMNRAGDHKFLERVAWCIDTRLKILGAYKQPVNPGTLVIKWEEMYSRPAVQDPIEVAIREAGTREQLDGSVPAPNDPANAPPGQADTPQKRSPPGAQAGEEIPSPGRLPRALLEFKAQMEDEKAGEGL